MAAKHRPAETDLDRGDLFSILGALADRLRVAGHAARGAALEQGGRDAAEYREAAALAAMVDEAADTLDALRARLCRDCGLLEVARRMRVG